MYDQRELEEFCDEYLRLDGNVFVEADMNISELDHEFNPPGSFDVDFIKKIPNVKNNNFITETLEEPDMSVQLDLLNQNFIANPFITEYRQSTREKDSIQSQGVVSSGAEISIKPPPLPDKEYEIDTELQGAIENHVSLDAQLSRITVPGNGRAIDNLSLWHSGPSCLELGQQSKSSVEHQDFSSSLSCSLYESSSFNCYTSSSKRTYSHQQLGAKVEMVYSLLSMLDTENREDMSKTFLAMSSSHESCHAMRQSGCLPLLVQLIHSAELDKEVRNRAAEALQNVVHAQSDEKRRKREIRVLKLLQHIREYSEEMKVISNVHEYPSTFDSEKHPITAMGTLMKFSFDAEHRQAICTLGGLHAISELIQADNEAHGNSTNDTQCITLRRYAGMSLTNLTFGDGKNKTLLCSFHKFMRALVDQLRSPSEDLRQVTASVLRNLSWRADSDSKQTLRQVGAVTALTISAMEGKKESTLKSILSALWNLSAHCSLNKIDICSVPGALAFLVKILRYKSPSNTLAIVENAGGILRNISSHIAVREDYRQILRDHNCFEVLLEQLKSPSLTIVSNACGTLWNLSARCSEDQKKLWEMGATTMLRSLVQSKHKMISMGSSAALKNLLAANPNRSLSSHMDSTAKSLGLQNLPTLFVRKQRALEQELSISLAETCDNIEPNGSPTHVKMEDTIVSTKRSDSYDSVVSSQSDSVCERMNHIVLKNEEKLLENDCGTMHESLQEKQGSRTAQDQKLMRRYKMSMIPTPTFKKVNQDGENEKTREDCSGEGTLSKTPVEVDGKKYASLEAKEISPKGIPEGFRMKPKAKIYPVTLELESSYTSSSLSKNSQQSPRDCTIKCETRGLLKSPGKKAVREIGDTTKAEPYDVFVCEKKMDEENKENHFKVTEEDLFDPRQSTRDKKKSNVWDRRQGAFGTVSGDENLVVVEKHSIDSEASEHQKGTSILIDVLSAVKHNSLQQKNTGLSCTPKQEILRNNNDVYDLSNSTPGADCTTKFQTVSEDLLDSAIRFERACVEDVSPSNNTVLEDCGGCFPKGNDQLQEDNNTLVDGSNFLKVDSNLLPLKSTEEIKAHEQKNSYDNFNHEMRPAQKTETMMTKFAITNGDMSPDDGTCEIQTRIETCDQPSCILLTSCDTRSQPPLLCMAVKKTGDTVGRNEGALEVAAHEADYIGSNHKKSNDMLTHREKNGFVPLIVAKDNELQDSCSKNFSYYDGCDFGVAGGERLVEKPNIGYIEEDLTKKLSNSVVPHFKIGSQITDVRVLQYEANKICQEIQRHQDVEMGCSLTSEVSLVSCSSFLDTGDYSLFEVSTDGSFSVTGDFEEPETQTLCKTSTEGKISQLRKPGATFHTAESATLPSLGSLKNDQLEALDLDNSVMSVASITSEIADTYTKDPNEFNTYTKKCNNYSNESLDDTLEDGDETLNPDLFQNNTELVDDDNSLHSQENLPLDCDVSPELSLDQPKRKLTPKEKRKTFHERYRTYTIRDLKGCNPTGIAENVSEQEKTDIHFVETGDSRRTYSSEFSYNRYYENPAHYDRQDIKEPHNSCSETFERESTHGALQISRSLDKDYDSNLTKISDSKSFSDLNVGPARRKELVDNATMVALSLKTAVQDFESISDIEVDDFEKSEAIDTATYSKNNKKFRNIHDGIHGAEEDVEKKGPRILKPQDRIQDNAGEEFLKAIRGRRKQLYSSPQKKPPKFNTPICNTPGIPQTGDSRPLPSTVLENSHSFSASLQREGTFTKVEGTEPKKTEGKNVRTIPVWSKKLEPKSATSIRSGIRNKSAPTPTNSKRDPDSMKIARPFSRPGERRSDSDSSQKRPASTGVHATGSRDAPASSKTQSTVGSRKHFLKSSCSSQNLRGSPTSTSSNVVRSSGPVAKSSISKSDASLNTISSHEKDKKTTPKKEVTSKIASLWRKVEETKQKNEIKKDNRVWIGYEKNDRISNEALVTEQEQILDITSRKIVHSFTSQELAEEFSLTGVQSSPEERNIIQCNSPVNLGVGKDKTKRRNVVSAIVSPYNYSPPVRVYEGTSDAEQGDSFHKGSLKVTMM